MPNGDDPDALDFSAQYNTSLPPDQEAAFQNWTQQQSTQTGRDVAGDNYDYDLRGWFAQNGPQDLSDAHLTDQFKKPNHPTFSDQSQYNGVDGYQGGQWQTKPDGSYSFTPGATNLYGQNDLQDYFNRVEPTNQLVAPQPIMAGRVAAALAPGQTAQDEIQPGMKDDYARQTDAMVAAAKAQLPPKNPDASYETWRPSTNVEDVRDQGMLKPYIDREKQRISEMADAIRHPLTPRNKRQPPPQTTDEE